MRTPMSEKGFPFSRAAGLAAGSTLWLVWAVFFPHTIPLYGVHLTNVKLKREIKDLDREIQGLLTDRKKFQAILESLGRDAVFWEAAARGSGMTREREKVVWTPRRN